jgi:hypothetical protein
MISIECFEGLPIEYESFLIQKYGSFITTCRYLEIYHPGYHFVYMPVTEDGKLIELLIFGNLNHTSKCFNSLVKIDQDIVSDGIKKLFKKYPAIKKVEIIASYKEYEIKKSFLSFKSDDYILPLPATLDEYYLELGCKTRKHIRQRRERLPKEFENVKFIAKFSNEIDESSISQIIKLNISRMTHKGIAIKCKEQHDTNYFKYAQHYGCLAYLEIDGLLVAGCISTILNNEIFLHKISHDNNFNKYNVGEVCVFNLINLSIEKGISTFHFLWGESELKKRFMAKPHLLFSYEVYRNYSTYYISGKIKTLSTRLVKKFKKSSIANPIRKAIRQIRKLRWNINAAKQA